MTSTRSASAPWRALGLLILGVLSAAGVWATHRYFVGTAVGQMTDESALQQAKAMNGGRLEGWSSQLLDALPAASVVVAIVVVGVVAATARRWWHAAIALIATLVANFGTQFLKNEVFDRPDLGVQTLLNNSLPSGHTTLAASSAAAIMLVAVPRWRPLAGLLGGMFAFVAGASTVLNLWHRPADVIAALLVVGTTTALAAVPITLLDSRSGRSARSNRGVNLKAGSAFWPFLTLVITGLAVFAFLAIPTLPVGALSRYGADLDTNVFWTWEAAIAAVTFGLVLLWQVLLPRRARI